MDKKEILDILDNAKDERGAVPMRLVRQAFDKLPTIQPEKTQPSREGTTKDATSDLISRRETIDRFNVIRPVDPKKDEYTKGIDVGIAMCIVAVKDQPTMQPEPQWIPVSERLPEKSEYYIITASDGVGHRTTFAKFQKKAKSWDLTGARSYWRVIAWMPLPKPFEGGIR